MENWATPSERTGFASVTVTAVSAGCVRMHGAWQGPGERKPVPIAVDAFHAAQWICVMFSASSAQLVDRDAGRTLGATPHEGTRGPPSRTDVYVEVSCPPIAEDDDAAGSDVTGNGI